MLENIDAVSEVQDEGINCASGIETRDFISRTEFSYISEIVSIGESEVIADRIDELGTSNPPKGIDSNADVADIIKPIKDTINPIYLEAPTDNIQIEEAVCALEDTDGLSYDEWISLSPEERVEAIQTLENKVSKIAHRPSCKISPSNCDAYGYYRPDFKDIIVNKDCLHSNSFKDYKETLDTVIHEGRHAYQDYNMNTREVHPRGSEVNNWRMNEQYGYMDATKFGFELYSMQPQEADAVAFAGDIINQFLKKQA